MKRFLSLAITPLYILLFFAILGVFHPLQMIALLFGRRVHKIVFDQMNLFLITNFRTMGTKIRVYRRGAPLPLGRPIIFVSNHQSMYDVPLQAWVLRKHYPMFISKRELGRGIPSISFALRNMDSVLIDRKDHEQALEAIAEFGRKIEAKRYSACIYPEGTRARDGKMRHFKAAGMVTLLKNMPSALVVPLVVQGSWEIVQHNLLPVPWGCTLSLTIMEPIDRSSLSDKEIVKTAEAIIRKELGQ